MKRLFQSICTSICVAGFTASPAGADSSWLVRARKGLVASDSAEASRAGLEILEAGGNAIDAAVAVSFALAVTRPYSTGLGGGGFMIVRFADGRVIVQDFRETAPAAATPDMYLRTKPKDTDGPPPSRFGHLAVAVPGVVAGRCAALSRYGTWPLARVAQPAIGLAKEGCPVDKHYVDATRKALAKIAKYPSLRETCGYILTTHLGAGQPRNVGDRLVQPKLARLLEGIARNGPEFFYSGPVAEAIARDMQRHGGLVTRRDLADYRVRQRRELRSTYRDYQLIGMPPPSSGGIAVAQTLNILESVDLPSVIARDHVLAAHYQIEAMKHAFADRARWLGDPDFVDVPVTKLTSKTYARQLAAKLGPETSAEPEGYGLANLPDDAGTSHFCVVDRWSNVVVSSETINTSFGSLVAIDEWGLILNNQMDDFAAEPGKPNAFGLVQSQQNAIAPGKRPLSSMAPTIVLKSGEPFVMLGASGGPRIISSVLGVLLDLTDYGKSLEEAILAVRPHHQWRPDLVYFDAAPSDDLIRGLQRRGHKLSNKRKTSVVQAILKGPEGWLGASDPRKGGRAGGLLTTGSQRGQFVLGTLCVRSRSVTRCETCFTRAMPEKGRGVHGRSCLRAF